MLVTSYMLCKMLLCILHNIIHAESLLLVRLGSSFPSIFSILSDSVLLSHASPSCLSLSVVVLSFLLAQMDGTRSLPRGCLVNRVSAPVLFYLLLVYSALNSLLMTRLMSP